MVAGQSACLRRVSSGTRSAIVGFGRFLANGKVSVERVITGWGTRTALACAGRHVLAIQDTSELNFRTTPERRRDLGEIGKGTGRGVLLHAMLAVDAGDGALLGLVTGKVWTRSGRVSVPHSKRRLGEKESGRWLDSAAASKAVLAAAACVTVVADRESDIYAEWAHLPEANVHLLTRAMGDRRIVGGKLSGADLAPAGGGPVALRARPGRAARTAQLSARFGPVSVKRPDGSIEPDLPKTVDLHLVEVIERDPPPGETPILWRLLTTHAVSDAAMAWRIVGWYRQRWTIEQFFRTLKQQGLRLEDSQVETAERLIKLTAIAAHAACVVMQLVHARDGRSRQPAAHAFSASERAALEALVPQLEGATAAQKNPHPPHSLAWAAWAIAKLGGWDGYASSRPPGPITFKNGLQRFKAIAEGWKLRHV